MAGMIVVRGDEVSFVPTNRGTGKAGTIDKILDAIPDLLEKVTGKTSKSTDGSDPKFE